MKIKLPDFIIADLYKDSLVVLNEGAIQPAEEVIAAAVTEEKPFYFGNNAQHICIVLNNATHVFTDDESLQLLSNLLAALNFTLADAAIINHYRTPVVYSQINEMLQPRVCLLFGISTQALQLPFIIPNYQLQRYEDCTFIQACSIDDMKANDDKAKAEKRKLWTCLKAVFNK
ncbi:hypothetical protein FC093_03965 [Ilyomonas limi]|jgi:hypothetical protein|uniref:DNA polymerase III subunit psi n=1 Tax=Ilyomonas limi TaxID=2575867 RepID=A0A4U3L6I2_9BACT|nr:hypothetical protein [Ilyomonas limi]TKK70861.1 hypothetical protein FC093_03965 [Ilyomonas limi]